MKLLGIPLRKPQSNELTGACALGVGLWVALLGVLRVAHVPVDLTDAGCLLLVVSWSCIATQLGIRVDRGSRHLLANLLVSATLIGGFQVAMAMSGA